MLYQTAQCAATPGRRAPVCAGGVGYMQDMAATQIEGFQATYEDTIYHR